MVPQVVNGQAETRSTTQPVTVDAGETSVETALNPTSQVQARLDDVTRRVGASDEQLVQLDSDPGEYRSLPVELIAFCR